MPDELNHQETSREAAVTQGLELVVLAATSLTALCLVGLLLSKMEELTAGQFLSGLAAVAALVVPGWSGRLRPGIFPVLRPLRVRLGLYLGCSSLLFLWWVFVYQFLLAGQDVTPGRMVWPVFWEVLIPAGAVGGLMSGLEAAARTRQ